MFLKILCKDGSESIINLAHILEIKRIGEEKWCIWDMDGDSIEFTEFTILPQLFIREVKNLKWKKIE